jgi:hypothetical protein
LGININSTTIGGLSILVWNRKRMSLMQGDELYIDSDAADLRPRLQQILGRELKVSAGGYPGLFRSEK